MELSKSAFIIIALLFALVICSAGCSKSPRELQNNEEPSQSLKITGNYAGCAIGAFLEDGSPTSLEVVSYEAAISREAAVVMWFLDFTSSFSAIPCDMLYDHGIVPMIAWEPWIAPNGLDMTYSLDKIVSGLHDTYIRNFALAIKSWGKPLLLRFAHEMNGNWYPWCGTNYGNSASTYIQAWRYVHATFEALGVNNVSWVFCPMDISYPGDAWNTASNYYPGDAYVDWVGFDTYSMPETSYNSFDTLAAPIYASLSVYGKPIMIGEMSRDEPDPETSENGKSVWITETFNKIKGSSYQKIKLYIWFNKNKTEGKMRYWRMDNWPACRISFEAAMKDPYYISIIH